MLGFTVDQVNERGAIAAIACVEMLGPFLRCPGSNQKSR
jgi:hypothetical protein